MPQVALQDHEGDGGVPGFGRLRADPECAHRAHPHPAALPSAGQAGADHRKESREGRRCLPKERRTFN